MNTSWGQLSLIEPKYDIIQHTKLIDSKAVTSPLELYVKLKTSHVVILDGPTQC